MKKTISIILAFFLTVGVAYATLTNGNIPSTKNGASNPPTVQNSPVSTDGTDVNVSTLQGSATVNGTTGALSVPGTIASTGTLGVIQFPYVPTPASNPPASYNYIYTKSNGNAYLLTPSGVETQITVIGASGVNWQSISNYQTGNYLRATTAGGVNWSSIYNLNQSGINWYSLPPTQGINWSNISPLTVGSLGMNGTATTSSGFTGTGNIVLANAPTFTGNPVGPGGGNINYQKIVCGNSAAAGTAVAVGTTPSLTFPTAGTIISATLSGSLSAGNCSATIDVWKANAALPTVANTITASALPALSTAKYHQDTTLTGWTKTISTNDVIMCNVQSSTCDNWNLVLGVKT